MRTSSVYCMCWTTIMQYAVLLYGRVAQWQSMGLQILRSPVRLRSRPLFFMFSFGPNCQQTTQTSVYYLWWGPWSSGYDSRFGCGRSRVRFPPDPGFFSIVKWHLNVLHGQQYNTMSCVRASGLVVWFPLWVREVAGSIPAWPRVFWKNSNA